MDKPLKITASILTADFRNLEDQIHQCEMAGIDGIHIDVMDGHFVPNITMGPFIVETCKKITQLPIDVHLMIDNPQEYILPFAEAGADYICTHVEINHHLHRLMDSIHSSGCKAGIVVNPGTALSTLDSILQYVDYVLLMSVNPGFAGQKYIPGTTRKIVELKQMIDLLQKDITIQVDGGINSETISSVYHSGANWIVAAKAIFNSGVDIITATRNLRSAVK